MEAAASKKEKQDRDDVKNAFAQLESAVEHIAEPKSGSGTTTTTAESAAAAGTTPPNATHEEAAAAAAVVTSSAAANNTTYSTRGRPTQEAQQQQQHESSSSQHIEAAGDLLSIAKDLIGVVSDHPNRNVVRESFLSDSLTEKEIRTRTRVLPNLDGMHGLRKSEVKSDLSIARGDKPPKAKRNKMRDNALVDGNNDMDTDNDTTVGTTTTATGTAMMVDGPTNGTTATNTTATTTTNNADEYNDPSVYRTVAIGKHHTLGLPSSSFLPPPAQPATTTGTTNNNNKRPSPRQVDSIVAYNPPRPPDSLGAKKEHRLRQWERRPEDIENDLIKYRKTVQKTSDELHNTEVELEAVNAADNILRRHFLHHVYHMNQEIVAIQEEMSLLQQECLDLCGNSSGRTRTRGSAKAGSVMRDILQALKVTGGGMMECDDDDDAGAFTPAASDRNLPVTGDGGLRIVNTQDWDRSTALGQPGDDNNASLASTWLPRKVETPCGPGTVIATVVASSSNDDRHWPPRVQVKLPFGQGYFSLDSLKVRQMDNPAAMTDEQLTERWKRLIASAKSFGAVIDTVGMTSRMLKESANKKSGDADGANGPASSASTGGNVNDALLPFGSDVLPTALGRGGFSYQASYEELVGQVRRMLSNGQGVLGRETNPGVRASFLAAENQQFEKLRLKAKALHLRNKLIRQHRTRVLNEKTYAATKERAAKVESLVDEMRSDLRSLKARLDAEMRDIGISDERAESILSRYYESLDSLHQGEASPPKRQRRSLLPDEMETGEHSRVLDMAAAPTNT